MTDINALLNDLAHLDAEHNLEGMRAVREQIVTQFPDADEAVEAQYKLGLDFLFRQRDITMALQAFKAAAKRKHQFWSLAARTSMGLCYYHQNHMQKALFELRRVAYTQTPNVHSVAALAFLENIFFETNKPEEMDKVRKERIKQLNTLIVNTKQEHPLKEERGYHLYQLGLAYADNDQESLAKESFEEAIALGPDVLGADLYRTLVDTR